MNNFLAIGRRRVHGVQPGHNALGGAQDIDAWSPTSQLFPGGINVPALDRIVAKP